MRRRERIFIKASFEGFGAGNTSRPAVVTPASDKTVVPFTATSAPSLTDYQDLYKSYGEHPVLQLKTVNENGEWQRNEPAKFIRDGEGLLTSIVWDLPDAETGFIIIS